MAFTARFANYDDLAECTRVESFTMGTYTYLGDAWNYYFSNKGQIVCVFDDDLMVGIGRLSVLPDGSGWLECLRVAPTHQNMGAGKLIYNEWLKLARQYGCKTLAMFTGPTNVRSAGLAEKYGLTLSGKHRGYTLAVNDSGNPHSFANVNWQRACQLAMPLKDEYNNYMTFNRTFYRVNEANVRAFADEGKVYEDANSDSFIVCGARFQHKKALHIAMMDGDFDKCIDFALHLAKSQNIPEITLNVCMDNPRLETALLNRGFVQSEGYLITKEGPVK